MLYDPKWEKQTKADPFTLESLIAWLEKQPPETEYEWENCDGGCLIGRYYTALFGADYRCRHHIVYSQVFQDNLKNYWWVCSRQSGPTTYGAALQRARALLAA